MTMLASFDSFLGNVGWVIGLGVGWMMVIGHLLGVITLPRWRKKG